MIIVYLCSGPKEIEEPIEADRDLEREINGLKDSLKKPETNSNWHKKA